MGRNIRSHWPHEICREETGNAFGESGVEKVSQELLDDTFITRHT